MHFKVLEQFIQMQSDKLLHLKKTKPLLLQMLSYHIVYHLNQLQFIHYRELGRIFPSLHQALLSTVDLNEAEVWMFQMRFCHPSTYYYIAMIDYIDYLCTPI